MSEAAQITIAFLAMAGLCHLLERVWPQQAAGRRWRGDSATDVLYFALRILLSAGLALGAGLAGTTLPDPGPSAVGSLPFVVQLAGFLFLSDFVQYWVHRLMHRLTPLWHVHAVHHSPNEVDWLVASRVHLFELAFNKAVSALPLYLVGFSPTVIAVAVPLAACYSLLLHANVPWTYGRLGYVITSPVFHRWHHALDRAARDRNFAQAFSAIDFVFGTAYFPRGRQPRQYGLVGEVMPRGIWQQFVYPLRAWWRLVRGSLPKGAPQPDTACVETPNREPATPAGLAVRSIPGIHADG